MQDIEHSFNSPKYELVISNGGPCFTYCCVFVQLCPCICQPVFVYVSKCCCVCVQMFLCMCPNDFVYVSTCFVYISKCVCVFYAFSIHLSSFVLGDRVPAALCCEGVRYMAFHGSLFYRFYPWISGIINNID